MKLTTATLSLVLVTATVFAQAPATATLRGRVTDPQGAAVAGASVSLRSTATGVHRELVADARGTFVLTDIAPGSYVIRVEASSLAPKEYPPITLQVGQNAEVTLRLEAAARSEKIDVTTEALAVQSVSSMVEGVHRARAIEHLPLNGRNFLELAFLVPGNAPAPNFDPTKTNSVVVSSAGQLGRGGNITIDGQDNNDDVVGGPLPNLPQDAVQEFQIATNRFSAEQGRSARLRHQRGHAQSGTDDLRRHRRRSSSATTRCRACPPPTTARSAKRRPSTASSTRWRSAGRWCKGRAWWFGAVEYRDQDGGGAGGHSATWPRARSGARFAAAPLDGLPGHRPPRLCSASAAERARPCATRFEDADDTGASTLDRAIGSASQRQASANRYHSVARRAGRARLGSRSASTRCA